MNKLAVMNPVGSTNWKKWQRVVPGEDGGAFRDGGEIR
jgi:hypothetical protein